MYYESEPSVIILLTAQYCVAVNTVLKFLSVLRI